MSHREWLPADFARQGLKQQWGALFRDFDVVICPPAATQAFQHDHSMPQEERKLAVDGKEVPYLHQLAWAELATTCGLPATVVPLGVGEGLPSGVQIIGPHLEDRTPLAFARRNRAPSSAGSRPRPATHRGVRAVRRTRRRGTGLSASDRQVVKTENAAKACSKRSRCGPILLPLSGQLPTPSAHSDCG